MTEKQSVLSKKFPQKLRQLRQEHGWSQGQLALKIGIDSNRVSRYERATLRPTLEVVAKLAALFEVSMDYLVRDEQQAALNKISNVELLKRVEKLEHLPLDTQNVLIYVLDAFIKKHWFEEAAQRNM